MNWWHGGGRIDGDEVLPAELTGMSRSGDEGVFVTTDRSLAATYASTVQGQAWVYEVEPFTTPTPTSSLVDPDAPPISFVTTGAKILRRFTVSNADRARVRSFMQVIGFNP